jgi:hypothetical protein
VGEQANERDAEQIANWRNECAKHGDFLRHQRKRYKPQSVQFGSVVLMQIFPPKALSFAPS